MSNRSPEKEAGDYFSGREPSAALQTPRPRRLHTDRFVSVQSPTSPTSPKTPRTPGFGRSLSTNWASPGFGFRQEDDYFIFEVSHRYLRAGLGGEAEPRCRLGCNPEFQRRAGDYSHWLSGDGTHDGGSVEEGPDHWSSSYEFWQMDLTKVDLGLVGDKIERALREAIRDHVLVLDDSKKRKTVLVIPPVFPHPLLSLLCTKVFDMYPPTPTITLLSSPTMCAVAAGLRSALIVDIGWASASLSVVYEYREVKHASSDRGMRLLFSNMKTMLESSIRIPTPQTSTGPPIPFEDVEDVVFRLAWCPSANESTSHNESGLGDDVTIQLSSHFVTLPFRRLAEPVEKSFIASPSNPRTIYDDDELPLAELMFETLLLLSLDIRKICLQRIIFVGGGSKIPGLKQRILADLEGMISRRGWNPVENYGSTKSPTNRQNPEKPTTSLLLDLPEPANKDINPETNTPASRQPPLPDPVLSKIKSRAAVRPTRDSRDLSQNFLGGQSIESRLEPRAQQVPLESAETASQTLRSVVSLGAWAGASLLTGLRVPGIVEIERERFLKDGLHVNNNPAEEKRRSMPAAQRHSLLGTTTAAKPADGTAWTLGIWA